MQPVTVVDLRPLWRGNLIMSGIPGHYIDLDGSLGLCELSLTQEMSRFRRYDVTMLIGLVDDEELGCLAYEDIIDAARQAGIRLFRLPLRDFTTPTPSQEAVWSGLMEHALPIVRHGGSVGLHCMAGIGRSGMMAGCLLVRLGMPAQDAMARIRASQPEALETDEQVAYLLSRRPGAG